MNNQVLTSLSIITSFHNKSQSIIDSFLPLVEYGIAILKAESEKTYYEVEELKDKIASSSGIVINSLSLKSLLKKLKKQERINVIDSSKYYQVIDSFLKEQNDYLAAIRDHHRSIHKFIKEYQKHSNDTREEQELIEWIYQFICEYREFIDMKNNSISVNFDNKNYEKLLSFLSYINEYESELSNVFHSIYFGANICSLLDTSSQVIAKKELKNIVIYLDSNFILRLMDLQEEQFTAETNELFEILKKSNITMFIFQETLEEIKSVLNYYLSIYKYNKDNYTALITNPEYIDGVLGAFFRRNLTISQIENFIDTVEEFVYNKGIRTDSIERYNIKIDENKLNSLIKEKYVELGEGKTKEYREHKCQNYIKIIEIIKYLRKTHDCISSCLGNSKYIFLTCDLKYYRYCKNRSNSYTFTPVVSQELLANDLLIFNQQDFSRISLQLMSSVYKTSKYIDIHVLDKLKDTIETISKENPSEAQYIIKATRNCEDYSILNAIFEDEKDDKAQLFELAKEIKKRDIEKELLLKDKEKEIELNEANIREKDKKIEDLEKRLITIEEERELEKKNKRNKEVEDCFECIKKYKKRIKVISVCSSIIFAIAVVAVSLIGGFSSWFSLPFTQSWWIWVLSGIFFIGSTVNAIITGVNNSWVERCVTKRENRFFNRYHLNQEEITYVKNKLEIN